MIPDRFKAQADRLAAIAEREAASNVGAIASEVAAFILSTTEREPGWKGALDEAETRIAARLTVHELAISELYRRIGPDPKDEAEKTVFGIPVVLTPGVTVERIRDEIDKTPPGLTRGEVLSRLEELDLLRRADTTKETGT